ncbi:MAG: OsmC family protein [Bacteroidia bacterium]|nr:OsmC family protein [Bacteroidia bacterium]
MTKINLQRINDAVHFECRNENGNTVLIDGSPDIGGLGKGARPMQLMLMAAASCSSIDIILILEKMRQKLEDIRVEVVAESEQMDTYSRWKSIHLKYFLKGDLNLKKAQKAAMLSIEKYCSVTKALEHSSIVTWEVEIEQ